MSKETDDKLISVLFKQYRHMLFKIAFGILNNKFDAEDAVQDAFLWIINNIEKICKIPCDEREVYFATIIEHISIDQLRKKKRHPTEDIDDHYDLCSNSFVDEKVLSQLTADEIKSALDDLSDIDYDLLYLYLFCGKTPKEISVIVGISERNIRTYIKRARERFIKILKKRGVIDGV